MNQSFFASRSRGLSIKDISQGGGALSSAAKGGKGDLQMRTSAFFGKKKSDFLKFMACPHEQGGGVEPVRRFFGQGRGIAIFAFRDFMRSLYGRPLVNCDVVQYIYK